MRSVYISYKIQEASELFHQVLKMQNTLSAKYICYQILDAKHSVKIAPKYYYKVPLVEGIMPAILSSNSKAILSARPKALNTVSIW